MTSALTLASTSPQRRAILEQLRIPFTAVAPSYVEHDPPDDAHDHTYYDAFSVEWARKWPSEEIWVAEKQA